METDRELLERLAREESSEDRNAFGEVITATPEERAAAREAVLRAMRELAGTL